MSRKSKYRQINRATSCADCGAYLPPGSQVRYYGRDQIYGVDCHSKGGRSVPVVDERSVDAWDAEMQDLAEYAWARDEMKHHDPHLEHPPWEI